MIDCQHLVSEWWEWRREGSAHPLDLSIRDHLERCDHCRRETARLAEACSLLPGLRRSPDADFRAGLDVRLSALRAGRPDPGGGRFEADPFLESVVPEPRPGQVIDLRSRSHWRRPLVLVATGAAAVLLVAQVARWTGEGGSPAGPPTAVVAETPAAVPDTPDSLKGPGETDARTGILADRPWQEEDSAAASRRPDRPDRLTPVTAGP